MNGLVFDYDRGYEPAAPVVRIEVDGYHATRSPQTTTALVDSGADATMLPLELLQAVGTQLKDTVWLKGVAGPRTQVDLFLVRLRLGHHTIAGVHAVALPSTEEAVLGRDALNQLVATLDGLAETTTIQR